jgi:hypothetical protein
MVGAKVGLAQTRNKHPASGGWKHPCACDYRRYVIAGRLRHWVVNRVKPPVQIATDNHRAYAFHIRQHFGYEGFNYGTETKIFGDRLLSDGTLARLGRNEGVRRMQTAERSAVLGSPDLESLTTSHIERAFLTVRQELKRFPAKDWVTAKTSKRTSWQSRSISAFTISFGNIIPWEQRKVGAGLEEKPWSLERVVEMTASYMERSI